LNSPAVGAEVLMLAPAWVINLVVSSPSNNTGVRVPLRGLELERARVHCGTRTLYRP
jgi:hypothetical protein